MPATDEFLVIAAQRGDVAALGQLLTRHRAAMMAVALAVLGRPDEAEDAVQDSALTVLARIGQLRQTGDPGPWLRMIVRNRCRSMLRGRQPARPVDDTMRLGDWDAREPESLLERHALKDWVAYAVARLPASLRTVVMLRYFSSVTSHKDIAALCGLPIGTVKRRLHDARGSLSTLLTAEGNFAYDGFSRLAERRADAEEAVAAGHRGGFGGYLRDGWHPEVDATWSSGLRLRGLDPLVEVMDTSMAAGIRQRVADVAATRDLVLWEIDVLNPAGPVGKHCPPRAYWLMTRAEGRVRELRMFHREATAGAHVRGEGADRG